MNNSVLIETVNKYGSPLYVYDLDIIAKRYNELHDCIKWPNLKIFYAMKANYNPHILRLLRDLGSGIDAVSPGDVLLAKKVGFSTDKILYTANNITDDEMHEVQREGVLFNIGSISRLKKFAKAFPGSKICLRFNPEVVDGENEKVMTGGALTKFGILFSELDTVKDIVNKFDLTVVGLHEHTGSGLQEESSVYKSMENIIEIATPDNFPDLEFLDFGGGFKVPYKEDEKRVDYQKMGMKICDIFENFCNKYGKKIDLYFEPGKFLVAESGCLLTEVNTIKNNNGRNIIGVNSGFPQLIRPILYDAYHSIRNLSNPDGDLHKYDVCGNICETGDRFAEERTLNFVSEGDIISVENAGAYCYAMGGVYNLRAMPREATIKDGQVQNCSKGISSKELIQNIYNENE